jgi:hypothetical protein
MGSTTMTRGVGERRELAVITARHGGRVVALQADVADGDVGEDVMERLQHAEAGAQDGDDDERPGQHEAGEGLERCGGGFFLGRQVARGVERQQQRDLVAQGAEERGLGGLVAQVGEHVGAERMGEDVERHGEILDFGFSIFDSENAGRGSGQVVTY